MDTNVGPVWAEHGTDGKVYLFIQQGAISAYRVCIKVVDNKNPVFVSWTDVDTGVIRKAVI